MIGPVGAGLSHPSKPPAGSQPSHTTYIENTNDSSVEVIYDVDPDLSVLEEAQALNSIPTMYGASHLLLRSATRLLGDPLTTRIRWPNN
jgi:hypothetical protein